MSIRALVVPIVGEPLFANTFTQRGDALVLPTIKPYKTPVEALIVVRLVDVAALVMFVAVTPPVEAAVCVTVGEPVHDTGCVACQNVPVTACEAGKFETVTLPSTVIELPPS
jgi:hypothetical protein